MVLKQRGLEKLIGTYIDKLPQCVNPADGRLHAHFNQLGTDTGRFSSSDPNLQNIPSHEKSIRLMFTASEYYEDIEWDELELCFKVPVLNDVKTQDGWINVKQLEVGDCILLGDSFERVTSLSEVGKFIQIYI